MKVKTLFSALTITFLSSATSVMAATAGREDRSLFLTWAFLGVCGVIIVLQLLKARQVK